MFPWSDAGARALRRRGRKVFIGWGLAVNNPAFRRARGGTIFVCDDGLPV